MKNPNMVWANLKQVSKLKKKLRLKSLTFTLFLRFSKIYYKFKIRYSFFIYKLLQSELNILTWKGFSRQMRLRMTLMSPQLFLVMIYVLLNWTLKAWLLSILLVSYVGQRANAISRILMDSLNIIVMIACLSTSSVWLLIPVCQISIHSP